MIYTIRIKDKSMKAKSIINMLKAFQDDYDFIEVSDDHVNEDVIRELEFRYNSYIKDPEGKEWDVLMNELTR